MHLSNGRPFDLFAVFPHCLDNEYVPEEDLGDSLRDNLSEDEKKHLGRRRDDAVNREFIRSLVYSPQVFLGRQSATSSPPLIDAIKSHRDALAKLMADGRVVFLLMEDSFDAFVKQPPFPVNVEGQKLWRDFLAANGERAICSLRLTDDLQKEVRRRYATFFRDLHDDDDNLNVLYAECSGREISHLVQPEVRAELEDFRALVKDDLQPWAWNIRWNEFGRSQIYNRYVWLKDGEADPAVRERRARHRLTMKRMADLAYNHNTPVAVGRQSFTPPGAPDPTSLPTHLYKPLGLPDVDASRRAAAGQAALSELLEQRTRAQQHFFYRMQEDMVLPDVGSLTISDVREIHEWSEWMYFKTAQDAAMRFSDADDLHSKLETLFDANVRLHDRLQHEMKHKSWWRRAAHGAVDLGVAVSAYMGCEALLPSHIHGALPPMLALLATGVTHRTLEAGIDLCIVGVEKATRRVVRTIGGRQTVSRQLTLTSDDWERLERLKAAEAASATAVRAEDDVIRQTEGLAKEV
jgi:hypothetical protein